MKSLILIATCVICSGFLGCAERAPESTKVVDEMAEHKHDSENAHYSCPMHPEVVSNAPGACPKCGMDLEIMEGAGHTGLHDATKFKMDFQTLPSALNASQAAVLKFTPRNAADNSVLADLKIVHEMPMHLLMVSNDLSWYAHEHPAVKPDGSYELAFRFPKADKYSLYADITPAGASHNQVFKLEKVVGQGTSAEPQLTMSNSFAADGYEYKMRSEPTALSAGKSATIVVMVSKGNKPVTNLENYLGALGHMVVISEDRQEFLHAHPEEHAHTAAEQKDPHHSHDNKMNHGAADKMPLDNGNGPHVSFMTLFPKAGKYKIWVQFNVDGKVRTAPFVVNVL